MKSAPQMPRWLVPVAVAPLFFAGLVHLAQAQDPAQDPEPRVVTPGTENTAPSDAVVLFDGKDLSAFKGVKSAEPKWKLGDGFMETTQTGGVITKEEFGDCQIHLEWASPSEVKGDGQGRGNSGVYVMGRYEIQVLDSYNNKTYPNGQCGAFYGHNPPLVNVCRKPGEWQSYDFIFHAPKKADDGTFTPGSFTILQNGVLIQDHIPVPEAASAGAPITEFSKTGPIYLQDHGNPVRFRNIWVRRL